MKIWLTEAINVENSAVVDNDKVEERIFDWEDEVEVSDVSSNETSVVKIKKISLFDHLIILNNVPCKLLAALTKDSF